ncbi:MAG: hypothetical protein M1370_09180 [Bacteroidetes bacterium]|nr:hypothetical protein [Bacteroidota bacterium]MCL5024913.1 hypothetical protein [Chloroflexota bacterium]
MAWYDDKNRATYAATYKDEKSLRKELEEVTKHGWMIQDTSSVGSHINVGRTVTGAVLTGGISLLFGASRSKKEVTVVFVRDPRWVAQRQIDEAVKPLKDRQSDYDKAVAELGKERNQFKARLATAGQGQSLNRYSLEMEVSKALGRLIDAQKKVIKQRDQLLDVITPALVVYNNAVSLGASLPKLPTRLDSEVSRLTSEAERDDHLLEGEIHVRQVQENLVQAAHSWREASEKLSDAQRRLAYADRQIANARQLTDSVPPEQADRAAKKLAEAEQERAKRFADVEKWTEESSRCERSMNQILEARSPLLAALSL